MAEVGNVDNIDSLSNSYLVELSMDEIKNFAEHLKLYPTFRNTFFIHLF